MENYEPEPIIEHYSDPFPFDIDNDPSYFQIKIDGKSTRLRTLVNRGLKNFGSGKKIVFIAAGRATTKAVSCVEIMKTYYKKPIHQITRINQIRTVETWRPLVDGLDPICVTRSVPMIYVLISQEPLEDTQNGYQVYNYREPTKVLKMQVVEEHETSLEDALENQNNIEQNNSENIENLPSDLSNEFTLMCMNESNNEIEKE